MSDIMQVMAEKILAKDEQARVAIAADKEAILTANNTWNSETVAAANAHIIAINDARKTQSETELDCIENIKTQLDNSIEEIKANDVPPADSIKEANQILDGDMQAFQDALKQSVGDLAAERALFESRVGDPDTLVLNATAAYEVQGIE